jgi:transcriptional regulator with XRE-family HTH domain
VAYRKTWTKRQREAFRRRMKAFRKRHGLTQAELAEAMGVDLMKVNRTECGDGVPFGKTVFGFAALVRRWTAKRVLRRRVC